MGTPLHPNIDGYFHTWCQHKQGGAEAHWMKKKKRRWQQSNVRSFGCFVLTAAACLRRAVKVTTNESRGHIMSASFAASVKWSQRRGETALAENVFLFLLYFFNCLTDTRDVWRKRAVFIRNSGVSLRPLWVSGFESQDLKRGSWGKTKT